MNKTCTRGEHTHKHLSPVRCRDGGEGRRVEGRGKGEGGEKKEVSRWKGGENENRQEGDDVIVSLCVIQQTPDVNTDGTKS